MASLWFGHAAGACEGWMLAGLDSRNRKKHLDGLWQETGLESGCLLQVMIPQRTMLFSESLGPDLVPNLGHLHSLKLTLIFLCMRCKSLTINLWGKYVSYHISSRCACLQQERTKVRPVIVQKTRANAQLSLDTRHGVPLCSMHGWYAARLGRGKWAS